MATQGKRFAQDFDRIDQVSANDKILIQNSGTGIVEYANPSQLKGIVAQGTVRYDSEQTLTEAQKAQARENIGASDDTYTKEEIDGFLADKQDTEDENLTTVDQTIVGAINEVSERSFEIAADVTDVTHSVENIEGKIPAQASSSNQLADKAFVNSSINALAAFYITNNASGDAFATKAALLAGPYYNAGVMRVPTKNDYAIVLADESKNGATTRYTYDGAVWAYQYKVNDTPLTAAQLAALNSNITADKVALIPTAQEKTKWNNTVRYDETQTLTDAQKAQARTNIDAPSKDGYYATLSAGYADKAADLDIHTSTMVHHTQVKAFDTTGGDKDVKDGAGFIRVVKGTENGIAAAGAKIISFGFNLIPSGSGTAFTFRCVKGEWGAYGTSEKNNGYLFTDSQGNILIPTSVKQNNVAVPTHTDHGKTYYLPSQDGQCTVVFATSQTNPCAHICWSNGRDNDYEAYNASQKDLASAINAIGGTLRRVGYVFDEVNLETKQGIRRLGYRLLNALSWTMEAGPTPEEGEATNTFRAIVSGGVASTDTIKDGGAFAIKGVSGLTFSLDGTSLVCDSTIASVADFVTALGSGTIEYELAVPVVATNTLNGEITISDYGIIVFENTAGATVVDIDFDFDQKWIDFVKNLPNDLEQMAGGIERAHEDIDALRNNRDNLGDVHAKSIDLDELPKVCHYEAIIKATTAPNVAPDFIGQMWIDTAAGKVYVATATTNSSSFKALN